MIQVFRLPLGQTVVGLLGRLRIPTTVVVLDLVMLMMNGVEFGT